jgi:7-cyano-7-deazaguanine reductase
MLDKVIADRVRNLKFTYTDKPQPDLLIALPNENLGIDHEVFIETSEFTSLCPLNLSQPDYAQIHIVYVPDELVVELKSLKFYLASFRQVPIFHEQVPCGILAALHGLLKPKWMQVTGNFTIRGGIKTTVVATSGRAN